MSKHITEHPLPWRFDGHGVNDAEGQRICKVSCCEPYQDGNVRYEEFDRLSKLIVRACNAHEELLEALHVAMRYIPRDGDAERDALEAAEDAIRKAEAGS